MIAENQSDDSGDRWEITSEQRAIVVDALLAIVVSDDWRCAIAAARALIAMDANNLKWEEFRAEQQAELIRLIHLRGH
jgi:hypothetical protein